MTVAFWLRRVTASPQQIQAIPRMGRGNQPVVAPPLDVVIFLRRILLPRKPAVSRDGRWSQRAQARRTSWYSIATPASVKAWLNIWTASWRWRRSSEQLVQIDGPQRKLSSSWPAIQAFRAPKGGSTGLPAPDKADETQPQRHRAPSISTHNLTGERSERASVR